MKPVLFLFILKLFNIIVMLNIDVWRGSVEVTILPQTIVPNRFLNFFLFNPLLLNQTLTSFIRTYLYNKQYRYVRK